MSLFLKIYDDDILHVICQLAPPSIKNPGYAYARIQKIIMFGYLPFQPFKKQCCQGQGQDIFEDLKGSRPRPKPRA